MKTIGVRDYYDKEFKPLGFEGVWRDSFGDVPKPFSAILFGEPGNGKTEMAVQFAKYLCRYDRVSWISYEQGHGPDLQKALKRNNMIDVSGKFIVVDPVYNRKGTYFDELNAYLSRRSTPHFIFLDSVDYIKLSKEEYNIIREKYSKRKSFIWISHAHGRHPKSAIGEEIEYDVQIKVHVRKFIAFTRSRFEGGEDYIIYEPKARELNPQYFKAK